MKLFGSYTSPFVRHCRIAVLQADLECGFVETNYEQSAEGSAAMRVPYLEHDQLKLHDSMSILRYLRELTDQRFCPTLEEYDLLLLVNTALDSTINLFLLENSGLDIASNSYMQRQARRVEQSLAYLNDVAAQGLEWNDAGIRLACFVDWAMFRQRLDFTNYPALVAWREQAQQSKEFIATAPPTA